MQKSNWKKCKLGEICQLIPGFAFKSKDFGNFCYKVVKIADIQPPKIESEHLTGVNLDNYPIDKLSKYLITYHDFCVAMTGATIGKLGRYQGKVPAYINQRVLLFKATPNAEKNFLYYTLYQKSFQSFIKNHIDSETAQPNISARSISKFEIDLPPIDEQKKIAGVLGAFDDKIELLQKQNTTLENMAKALFKSWFVDFDVVHAKQQGQPKAAVMQQYHLTEELYNLFPSSFEPSALGPIPTGWQVKNAGDLLKFSIGGGWGNEEKTTEFSIKAPVIRGTDIPNLRHSGAYKDVPVRYHKVSNHTSRVLQVGDIILETAGGSKGQPVGRTLLIDTYITKVLPNAICASFCKLLRPNKTLISSTLLYFYLDRMYQTGEIELYQVQSTGISNFQFKQFLEDKQFIVPQLILQEKLFINQYIDKIGNNKQQIQTLTEMRDALLPRLISGKIRV